MTVTLQPYIGAEIPTLTDSLRASVKQKYGQDIPFEVMAAWLSAFVDSHQKEHFTLSRTRPDFEGIKIQFIARVRQTKGWKDVIQAGWAQTLAEFFAAIGDYGQNSIMRAYQESGIDARLSSSIYMQMRSLGVHIDRVKPAQVQVSLFGDGLAAQTIPELSSFSIGQDTFFNREPIQFNYNTTAETALSVTLWQGAIQTEACISRGVPFQYFEIGDENSNISNSDLYCFTATGEPYQDVQDGLWGYAPEAAVFYSNMTPSGNVEILFGNNVYGKIPDIDTVLYVMYAESRGSDANNAQINQVVSLNDINENVPHRIRNTATQTISDQIEFLTTAVQGVTTSAVMNGEALKDKEFYRAVGPAIRASKGRMVNRQDHYAQGLRYPKLVDIRFQGQKEYAPHDRRFTNVIHVTPLLDSGLPMTDAEWAMFVDYLTNISIWGRGIEYIKINATPRYFDVAGDVYMTKDSSLANVESYLRYTFSDFFRIQRGSLGRSVYGSDLESRFKFKYADMNVDFVQNIKPSACEDTILGITEYPVLRSFTPKVFLSGRDAKFAPPREVY